jgi:mRNA interferase HigB
MRILKLKTLQEFSHHYPETAQALRAWYGEAQAAQWKTPQELKQQYRHASVLSNKRVVFNLKGNTYRLIVDIEYRLGLVFIVWIGTHEEYDAIDATTISYQDYEAHKKF